MTNITSHTCEILTQRNIMEERLTAELSNLSIDVEERTSVLRKAGHDRDEKLLYLRNVLKEVGSWKMEAAIAKFLVAHNKYDKISDQRHEIEEMHEAKAEELTDYVRDTEQIREGLVQIICDCDCDWDAAESLRTQFNEGTLHA